jgi:hypothetical protein
MAHRSTVVPNVKWPPLVVPDVRGQVYVFAKGMLEDAGFGFRVEGSVPGYASNHVAVQVPAPGTKVFNTGAPVVTLHLSGTAKAQGSPQNLAPYPTTSPRPFHRVARASRVAPKAAAPKAPAPKAVAAPKAHAAAHAKRTHARHAAPTAARRRPPDFVIPGATREPLDEMPLVDRARQLDRWAASHPAHTSANVNRWLFQQSWIVTGARFGWWHGAQALEVLIGTDRRIEAEWGVGARSLQEARATLAWVQARKPTK